MSLFVLELEKAELPKTSIRMSGTLTLNGKSYSIVTGGFGRGYLPTGTYKVKIRNVVDKGLGPGFRIGNTEYFIPIESQFPSSRSGLGIHPDGPPIGTKGCIGIQGNDAKKFWTHWTSLPLSSRPTKLIVRWIMSDFPISTRSYRLA